MFWEEKSLSEMTQEEWELLCDGCGRCCLVKLEDEDTGHVHYTDVACRLLDLGVCRCSDYENRTRRVRDCIAFSPETIGDVDWLPPTCAYKLVAQNRDLRWWHPLVSGTRETVREAGISVHGRVVSEEGVADEDLEDHLVAWPLSRAEAPQEDDR